MLASMDQYPRTISVRFVCLYHELRWWAILHSCYVVAATVTHVTWMISTLVSVEWGIDGGWVLWVGL